jgi:hypothetical protein
MAPKRQPQSDLDIFRSRLENIIDMRHPTVLLAQRIDWDAIAVSFGKFFCVCGKKRCASRYKPYSHISQPLICAEMSGSTWYNANPL